MAAGEPLPTCYAGGTKSAWFAVKTSIKGALQVFVDGGFPGDLHSIALYEGTTLADLHELSCSADQPTIMALSAYLRAGSTVYVQVIADGPFTFRGTMYPTPFIDNFADAEQLTLGYTSNGAWTTEGGTVESGEPLPCGGTLTSWLKFVPEQSTTVTFMTLSGQNDVLALYRGAALANLQFLGCGASNIYPVSGETTSRVETRLTAMVQKGASYYLQIGAREGSGSGIVLSVSRGVAVANDAPTTPLALSQNHTAVGSTVGAFTRPLTSTCPYLFGTVWYSVTPQSTGTLEVVVDSQPTDARFNFAPSVAIHRADTGELLACGQDTIWTVRQTAPVESGVSYLIAVMSVGFPGDYRMHWAVQ